MPTDAAQSDRILRRFEVQSRTGLARSTLYALVKANKFPAPVRLTDTAVGWRESDVAAWIDSRPTTGEEGDPA